MSKPDLLGLLKDSGVTPNDVIEAYSPAKLQIVLGGLVGVINQILRANSNVAMLNNDMPVRVWSRDCEPEWLAFHALVAEYYQSLGWSVKQIEDVDGSPCYEFRLPQRWGGYPKKD